jgi:imidazole glycerol phosphate synthase glutamine amidotransferase subunit
MASKIGLIDYGMGNLFSVANTFAALGVDIEVVTRARGLDRLDKLVLPGVGAFGDAMRELKDRHLIEPVRAFVRSGRPFLGICLGMQLLMDESDEAPGVAGLGLIRGTVKRFSKRLKVPHMGWNEIEPRRGAAIFRGIRRPVYAYFCHSYYVVPQDTRAVAGQTHDATPHNVNGRNDQHSAIKFLSI